MSLNAEQLAAALNAACHCSGANIGELQRDIERALRHSLPQAVLIESHPHLFSSVPVFLTDDHAAQMKRVIAAVERVVQLPAYQAQVFTAVISDVAIAANASRGVFLGYDFHITPEGPRLIEINTNAGGALLNLELLTTQLRCCMEAPALSASSTPSTIAAEFVDMFRQEWRLNRGDTPLLRVAITDETPSLQYLYPEFVLFKQLLEAHGIQTVIVDPAQLAFVDGRLTHDGNGIDLVYNRLTDFYFDKADHLHLRAAYLANAAVFTPTPRNHALYANKRHLTIFSDAQVLRDLGADSGTIETLIQSVPPTRLVQASDADDWWAKRKQWFFKPTRGFGSRGVYRGDKLTRGVFQDIISAEYVAQALVPASERQHPVNGPGAFKVDVRNYVYDGRVQLIAARLYKGQTTNFRTPGGGFAPVFFASEARLAQAGECSLAKCGRRMSDLQ